MHDGVNFPWVKVEARMNAAIINLPVFLYDMPCRNIYFTNTLNLQSCVKFVV